MTTVAHRPSVTYTPQWQRFQTDRISGSDTPATHPYQRQYAHVYHQRLAILGPRIWAGIPSNSEISHVKRILELKENVISVVVGTLVKEREGEPLMEGNKCRKDDEIFLEDESGRVALLTDQLHALPTGVCIGVKGTVGLDGVMTVQEMFTPTFEAPSPAPPSDDGSYVMLVSGLNCGSAEASSLPRDMLVSYLHGRMGHLASKISRVVVAGGLTAQPSALKELDAFCLDLVSAGLPMDLIPGQGDATTANWPQRPLHPSLLKRSARYEKFVRRSPNPYASDVDQVTFLGTDGRNIADLQQQMLVNNAPPSAMDALQSTLTWGHVCPTGPDSVPTCPHADSDPMVLVQRPHVYFSGGNHPFGTRLVDGTRLICVPSFSETGQAVLVHLPTLDVQVVQFQE